MNAFYKMIVPFAFAVALFVGFIMVRNNMRGEQYKNDEMVDSITEAVGGNGESDLSSLIDAALEENTASKTPDDIKNMTADELSGKTNDAEKPKTKLEEDLGIQYTEASYLGVTTDGAFYLDTGKEQKLIYLIGVVDVDADALTDYLSSFDTIYIEYDISKKHGDYEQAYLWTAVPNAKSKESMINGVVLLNGWGTYKDPMPNIKYTYYLIDQKPGK